MDFRWGIDHNLPRAAGHFDRLQLSALDLEFCVEGWALSLDEEADEYHLYLDGEFIGAAERMCRADVSRAIPWVSHAECSGFRFRGKLSPAALTEKVHTVEVLCRKSGRPLAYISTMYADSERLDRIPPLKLANRIGSPTLRDYKHQGLKMFSDIVQVAAANVDLFHCRQLLDWGCGSGRLTAHLLVHLRCEVFGCDVDPAAINWCERNLPEGKFHCIGSLPPSSYQDQQFDIIIGCSVFTHLSEEHQRLWLSEIKRVAAPNAIIIVSVLGAYAFRRRFDCSVAEGRLLTRILRKRRAARASAGLSERGIFDALTNKSLSEFLPQGYYRDVYQTVDYTMAAWSPFFKIVQYIERGLGNFQDLVVMRNS